MAPDIMERWKASAQHQLCLALLPFTHARSESISADSLNSNFLQLGRRSGGRLQRTVHPRRLPVDTVIHTTLVGLELTTFRLLVRRATSSATDSPTAVCPVSVGGQPTKGTRTIGIYFYSAQVSDAWHLATANGHIAQSAARKFQIDLKHS